MSLNFKLLFFTLLSNYIFSQNIETERDIHILVKASEKSLSSYFRFNRGKLKYTIKGISSIQIKNTDLKDFINLVKPDAIEYGFGKGMYFSDSSRIINNIDSIHNGMGQLSNEYKGEGVIIGIVDGSIYFQHQDFRKSDSTTRIRFLWDQDYAGANSPQPYNYGNHWNWIDINNGNCFHVPDINDDSHGTCVTGIAAGNGTSFFDSTTMDYRYRGIAPESEVIFVKVKNDEQFTTHVTDAVDYIFKMADALGKPCVVNLSIGGYGGSHDGLDLSSQVISFLLNERNGRSVIAAAGNQGQTAFHLGYEIPSDSAYTFFSYYYPDNDIHFEFYADSIKFNNAFFKINCHQQNATFLAGTEYFNIPIHFNPGLGPSNSVQLSRNIFNGFDFLGQVVIRVEFSNNRYYVKIRVIPVNDNYIWSLQTKGSGRFDLWSHPDLTYSSPILLNLFDTIPIQFPNYKKPDTLMTVAGYWASSPDIITVANYSNRNGYLDRNNTYIDLSALDDFQIVGKRISHSGVGPNRLGIIKPDISASGSYTLASGDANLISTLITPQLQTIVAPSRYHIRAGGTSISSAIVSGTVALYLEKKPQATADEIRKVLRWSARKDQFTGNLENNYYGYGKLNGYSTLTYNGIIYGCMDSTALNFSSFANVDTGGCIPIILGCMDSLALNYNPNATLDDGSCELLKVRENENIHYLFYNSDNQVLNFRTGDNGILKIYTIDGKLIQSLEFEGKVNNSLTLKLSNALYLSCFDFNNGKKIIRKLVYK